MRTTSTSGISITYKFIPFSPIKSFQLHHICFHVDSGLYFMSPQPVMSHLLKGKYEYIPVKDHYNKMYACMYK